MSRTIAVLLLACLANVCVSATGISETSPDAPSDMQPIDGVPNGDDDRPNYIAFNGNSFNDNDLLPGSSAAGSPGPNGGRDADGLTRGLYGWSGVPGMRINPDLLASLRAAYEVANGGLLEPHSVEQQALRLNEDGTVFGFETGRNLPKRAPTGFTGMRGRRIPSGFNGMRGKKALSLFSWNNQAARSGPNTYRDGKRAPSGFLGMRGKKSLDTSLDERWRMDDSVTDQQEKEYPNYLVLDPASFGSSGIAAPPKRVPNGFMGLRGKKDCC